jgi:hypothetical protein
MGTPPRPGQPRQDRRGPEACHERLRLKRSGPAADTSSMRIVLEWLGLVEPRGDRRGPVVVPAWAPLAVCLAACTAIYLLSLAARALVG